MATSVQQLLDDLTAQIRAPAATATIEDVTGALAHLGRSLSGLAEDGLTLGDSRRQRTATALAAAWCTKSSSGAAAGGSSRRPPPAQ